MRTPRSVVSPASLTRGGVLTNVDTGGSGRNRQADEQQRAAERIAVLADVAQLVNQIEEREQAQQRDEDQQRRVENFAPDVTRERLHARAGRRWNSPVTDNRFQNRTTTPAIAIVWMRMSPPGIDSFPCAMTLWTRLRQLL